MTRGLAASCKRVMLLVACCVGAACSSGAPDDGREASATRDSTSADEPQAGRTFARAIAFLAPRTDSSLMVPWLIGARTEPGGVRREVRAWLGRGGVWEPFFSERWRSEPTTVPWRILPRGDMRLIVGQANTLERIVFQAGPRHLEMVLGPTLAEWSGRRGDSYRVLEGAVVLSNQRVEGIILDLSRARRSADAPPGDWALLASGDSLQMLLAAAVAQPQGTAGAYQAWARLDAEEMQWPRVTLTWTRTRAFETARRDVPVTWNVLSSDAEMGATLDVRSAHIEAGEGEGPLLPVQALFEVEGSVRIGEATYPVRGIYRHVQP